jgi:HAD superfamily hydrolase (TIGR01549 family)
LFTFRRCLVTPGLSSQRAFQRIERSAETLYWPDPPSQAETVLAAGDPAHEAGRSARSEGVCDLRVLECPPGGQATAERWPIRAPRPTLDSTVTRLSPAAITFDFGNTLVPVSRASLDAVVEAMTTAVVARSGPFDRGEFLSAWAEERERQFAEEVPDGREVDLEQRVVRVLARIRGMPTPSASAAWDDTAAAALSELAERLAAIDDYSVAFVELMPVPAEVGPLLAQLAEKRPLGVVSNWPHAATIDRYLEAAGWARYFRAVIISQRVGSIKPLPPIFAAAEAALGVPGPRILHVGDDWTADVEGAKRAGWLAAYLRDSQADSPLPSSERDGSVAPDLELDRLTDLPAALEA